MSKKTLPPIYFVVLFDMLGWALTPSVHVTPGDVRLSSRTTSPNPVGA